MDEYIYTADDEIPNCSRCDNASEELWCCEECCGAEHGWNGYRRTEIEGEQEG